MHRKVPLRLVEITASKSASLMRMSRLSRVIPALFTRMSIRPKVSTAAFTSASTWAASDTSQRIARALAPRASISRTVSWAAASLPA